MGTFNTTKTFNASSELMLGIADEIEVTFQSEGYDVDKQMLMTGGYDISISKGGVFKAVLGMKSALKVNIYYAYGKITVEAGVGIFGQQAVPTVISMFFLWPVLITQIWGLVQQSKLDDRVIDIAQTYIEQHSNSAKPNITARKFCTRCGGAVPADAKFCSQCGALMD